MSTIKGRVWSTPWRKRCRLWHYEVAVDGVVVNYDNTADWRTVYDGCRAAALATQAAVRSGQRLRPWADLVSEARP